jgi:DNA polymerase-1
MLAVAARYGVDNVNSTAQVAAAFEAMGESLNDKTAGGAVKVDKAVLLPLADLSLQWGRLDVRTPNPLADAVLRAKRAEKWRQSYEQSFTELRDSADRLHPSIHSLQARTARMSVSNPPLQQLPSGDWTVRRAFIADEGMSMFSVDYAAVELRVVAALAGESRMLDAFRNGADLHDVTATAIFGPNFTKAQRGLAKVTAFATVYGGGATGIARQTGQSVATTRPIVNKFHNTYPALGRYASQLQRDSGNGARPVVTPTGRQLLLDNDRTYAATNYVVQSTARDVMAQALINLDTAGLSEFLLLPIHDEVIAQAPTADVADVAAEVARVMRFDNFLDSGIDLTTDSELFGATWANGYGYLESTK